MNDQASYYEFICQSDALFAKHYLMKLCSQLNNAPKISSSTDSSDQCFEELTGYVLNGLAGALEHGLTLDQCRCLCATTETSGKYSFPCKSILYYPVEKDCVLNAGNRLERPDLFRKDTTSYKIIYSGITCDGKIYYVFFTLVFCHLHFFHFLYRRTCQKVCRHKMQGEATCCRIISRYDHKQLRYCWYSGYD